MAERAGGFRSAGRRAAGGTFFMGLNRNVLTPSSSWSSSSQPTLLRWEFLTLASLGARRRIRWLRVSETNKEPSFKKQAEYGWLNIALKPLPSLQPLDPQPATLM